ncbi:patatin-like phospholipase domain-containing protein 4 isoform X2 [Mytilus edulis]|uniref:patatin-like phospholipase domain-containing protein 4 isoform X2 n=1 Tax=Mytilus edulis TaxID=6550 RepID=UPI0039EFC339
MKIITKKDQKKNAQNSDNNYEKEMNLSLCGCGFLGIYHLGVAACLKQHGASFLSSIQKVAGASAGALVASVLVIDDSKIEECKNFTYGLAKEVKSKPLGALTPGYNLLDSIKTFLNTMLPEDAHQKASGKLYISLTNTRTRENVLVHQYPSREHLIKCLLASSHIPLYASRLPVKIDGQKYMDGGITDNMVVFKNERTIQVSPFCGRQDISPNDKLGKEWYVSVNNQGFQVNKNNLIRFSHAMIPPSNKVLVQYYNQGFKDAKTFLIKEKIL